MLDETEIQDKLSHAATLMSNRAPILLGFYIMLEKRMTSDKSVTMRVGCTDGQPYLEYSDWFVNAMEPSLLGAVVYANCLRIALHHCDTRVKMPEAMFRLASDLVVYEYARNVVNTTAGDNSAIVGQLFPSIWAYADKFGAAGFDPVKDLTLEKVFDLLMQAQEESKNETEEENPDGGQDNGGQGGTATRAMKAMKKVAVRTTRENPVAMTKTRKTERTRAAVAATGNQMTPTAKKAKGKVPVKDRPTVPAKEMARRVKPTRPSSRCSTRTAPLPT